MSGDRRSPAELLYLVYRAIVVVALTVTVVVCGWDFLVDTDTDRGYSTGYLPLWTWLFALVVSILRCAVGAKIPAEAADKWVTVTVALASVPVAFATFLHAVGSQGS